MANNVVNKYLWLVTAFHRYGRITLKELSDKWQSNESLSDGKPLARQTFNNLRKKVEEIFDIIISCDGFNRYYIEDTEDIKQTGVRNWLLNTIALKNTLTENQNLKDRIILEDSPSKEPYLISLIHAMQDSLQVEITYQSIFKDTENTFIIEPYLLKNFKKRWYIVANSFYTDKIMIYSLDRIKSINVLKSHFDYQQDFSATEYFAGCYGIIAESTIPIQTVRIKVYNNQDKYFISLPLHETQKIVEQTEDYTVFEYYLRPTYDFLQELFSFNEDIEVLSPDTLRKEIKQKIRRMWQTYK